MVSWTTKKKVAKKKRSGPVPCSQLSIIQIKNGGIFPGSINVILGC